jgi:hypothetical protein
MLHGIIAISVVCFRASFPPIGELAILVGFLCLGVGNYIDVPAQLLAGSLWKTPLVFGGLGDCFQFLIDFRWDFCFIHFLF